MTTSTRSRLRRDAAEEVGDPEGQAGAEGEEDGGHGREASHTVRSTEHG